MDTPADEYLSYLDGALDRLGLSCPDSETPQPQRCTQSDTSAGLDAVETQINSLIQIEARPLEARNPSLPFLAAHNYTLTPIYTLPPEVLHLIFAVAFESSSKPIETTRSISQVSRIWRDVAIQQSELWRRISPSMDQYIDLWITRSNSQPLSLEFGSVHPCCFYRLVGRRDDILPRVRDIIIRWRPHLEFRHPLADIHFPALECVTLLGFSNGVGSEGTVVGQNFENLLPHMPLLRRLNLDGMGPIRGAAIASVLTELHIHHCFMGPSSWEFLADVRCLHTLVISHVTTTAGYTSIASGWELPSLRILQFEACDPETLRLLCDQVISPNLHDLRLLSYSEGESSHRNVDIPLIGLASLRRLLKASPNLKKVSLTVSLRTLDGIVAGAVSISNPSTFQAPVAAELDEIRVTIADTAVSDSFPISTADAEMAISFIASYVKFRGILLPFRRSGNTVISRPGEAGQKAPILYITGPSWITDALSSTLAR